MSNWKTGNQTYGSHSAPKKKIGKSTIGYLEANDNTGFIHEQENIAKRERHGLFSQPINLAPGDAYRDPEIDKPEKRMEVNNRLQEKVGPELFSKMTSTNLGDPYKDPFRAKQLYLKQKNDLTIHPKAFNAGGKQKLVKNSEFEHVKDYADKQYNTRGADGKVLTGQKGVMTNNMKKGFGNVAVGHLFGSYPYIGYPEDDQRAINSNQRLVHKAKIPSSFRGSSHPSKTFTPDYAVYNNGEPYNQKKEDQQYRPKEPNRWKANNPNKKGYNGTFTAFPQYIEEGEKAKAPPKNDGVWIPNFNGTSKGLGETLTRPCPPASQLPLNEMRRTKA